MALLSGGGAAVMMCAWFPLGTLMGVVCLIHLLNGEFVEHWFADKGTAGRRL